MLSNLKNVFKVPDLRNKILFTSAMVALYRLGVPIRVPGVDADAVHQFKEAANSQGALGFLNLFSGGAFDSFSIFALGIMPYITASIIMQVLGVVIPKLEELQQQGAVGQRKITQYTRYVAIGWRRCRPPAWCSSSAPAGTAFFSAAARRRSVPLLPDGVWPRGLPDHPDARRRHGAAHVDRRADQPARHRQRHVDDHLRLGRHRPAATATTRSSRSTSGSRSG